MHAAWFSAAIPDSTAICLKLPLLPYCLGHEILLQRLNSPLIAPSAFSLEPSALILAVLICSQPYESGLRAIHSPWLTVFLRFWRWRLGRRIDWTAELQRYVAHRRAGLWMPECNPPAGGSGRTLEAPWQFRLLMILMRDFHFTESAALNYPIAKAHILFAAHGDMEGTLDLFGPSDQALLDKLDELEGSTGVAPVLSGVAPESSSLRQGPRAAGRDARQNGRDGRATREAAWA